MTFESLHARGESCHDSEARNVSRAVLRRNIQAVCDNDGFDLTIRFQMAALSKWETSALRRLKRYSSRT